MQKVITLLIKRTTTILLVAAFVLQPLAVLAEESVTKESVPEQNDSTVIADSPEENGEVGQIINDQFNEDVSSSYKQEPSSRQDQRKLPGTSGDFLVDNFSGSATYSYNLEIPSGRSELSPSLKLSYNSNNSSGYGSVVGVGWQLSQSYIVRQNKAGTNNLYSGHDFGLVFNGEQIDLLPKDLSQGIYGPQIESDFLKAVYSTSTGWTVYDKKGWLYVFGDTGTTQQYDPNNQNRIYSWWLKRITDNNGNTIDLQYYKDGNQIYPKIINYTGNGQQLGQFEIRFEPFFSGPQNSNIRPDITTKYNSAFPVTTRYRLEEIQIYSDAQKKSGYKIDYFSGQNGTTSLLKSVQEYSYKNGSLVYLPKVDFQYSQKEIGYINDTQNWPVDSWSNFSCYNLSTQTVREAPLADYNSDSWPDRSSGQFSPNEKKWKPYSNFDFNGYISNHFEYTDFDNDGKIDILKPGSNSSEPPKVTFLKNTGTGFEVYPFTLPESMNQYQGSLSMEQFSLIDVNGDGIGDIVFSASVYFPWGVYSNRNEIWINKGDNTFEQSYGALPVYDKNCDAGIAPPKCSSDGQFFDINNDGLIDYIKRDVYLNNGSGFNQTPSVEWLGSGNELWKGGARYSDMNSDGLVDYSIAFKSSKLVGGVYIPYEERKTLINNGNGWTEDNNWNSPLIYANLWSDASDYGTRIIDVNGDGGVDIVRKDCDQNTAGVYLSKSGKSNLLKKIIVNNSLQTEIEYSMSGLVSDNKLPISLPIVKSIKEYDGLGGQKTTNYQYAYGHYYVDIQKPNNNQFAGFGVVTVDNEDFKTKLFFHQGGGFDGYQFGEIDPWPLKGRQYREEVYSKNNGEEKLEKIVTQQWKKTDLPNDRYKVQLEAASTFDNKNDLTAIQIKNNNVFKSAKQNTFKTKAGLTRNKTEQVVKDLSGDGGEIVYLGKDGNKYKYRYTGQINSFDANKSGSVYRNVNDENISWSQLIAGTGSGDVNNGRISIGTTMCSQSKTAFRSYLLFDTKSIPDEATIDVAKLWFSTNNGNVNEMGKEAHVVKWNKSDDELVNNQDFTKVGSVSGGSEIIKRKVGGINLYFNDYGKSLIGVSTSTKLALRNDDDLRVLNPGCGGNDYLSNIDEYNLQVEFSLSQPYTLPTSLEVNNQSNPYTIKPPLDFSAEFHAQSASSTAKNWRIQIARAEDDYSNLIWDSGKQIVLGTIGVNQRVGGMMYSGPQFNYDGSLYKWRVKFWDNLDNEGSWSTEQATFASLLSAHGRRVEYQYNNNNQIIQEKSLGDSLLDVINGNLINEISGDEQTTNYEYASSTSDLPIINAVKQKTLSSATESVTYRQKSYYDQLPYGQVSKNNKTKDDYIVQQINQQFVYDNYGLPIKQIDPLAKETIYEYDAKHLYPTKITNAKGQVVNMVYDNFTGQPTLITDPNGLQEQRNYDAFGRIINVKKSAHGGSDTLVELEHYTYDDFSMPRMVRKETRVDQNDWNSVVEYYNGLGQLIQTRSKFSDSNYAVVSQQYDSLGRVIKITLPYLSGGDAYAPETWTTAVTEKEYDVLNRVVKEITPVGINTFSYDGFVTTITDASGVQKKLERDAYDRLVAVDEYIDGQFVKTRYEYNVLGKITKIIDSQNNQREFVYDDLGRLLSQTEIHKPGVSGNSWQYVYDQASRVTQQTDPNGNVTNYTYDQLGRVVNETTSDGQINYGYDKDDNAIGRLVSVNSSYGLGYKKDIKYNLWGSVIKEDVTINKRPFTTLYEYDLVGKNINTTEPNGTVIQNKYDTQGRFNGFLFVGLELSPKEVIKNVTYHVSGRPATIEYKDGMNTNYEYDSQTQRLVKKLTELNGNNFQDLNYQYDSLGNIVQIEDNSNSKTAKRVTYEYDTLSRLVRATAVNTANDQDYEETYSYDWLGNILNKTGVGEYLYSNNNPHQATTIGRNNYTYDANGNVINDENNTYIYNANNRLTKVTSADNKLISDYVYDSSGTRVYKKVSKIIGSEVEISSNLDSSHNLTLPEDNDGGGSKVSVVETYYPNSFYELVNDNNRESASLHVYGLGQRLAQIDGTSVKLILTDHLGSTQQVINDHGEVLATYDYYPFGEVRIGGEDNGSKKQFSGKIKDETNLNYFEARYLDTATGRFSSQDIEVVNVAISEKQQGILIEPQRLNDYGYALNNPIKNLDNSGEYVETVFDVLCTALSMREFYSSPTILNGLFLGLDVAGTSLPGIPSVAGYARHGYQAINTLRYFEKISNYIRQSGKTMHVIDITSIFIKNIFFKQDGLLKFVAGEVGDSTTNLVGHFVKHADSFGFKTLKAYYEGAVNFITKTKIDNKRFFSFSSSSGSGDLEIWDNVTKTLGVKTADNEIRSFYKVTEEWKLMEMESKVNRVIK